MARPSPVGYSPRKGDPGTGTRAIATANFGDLFLEFDAFYGWRLFPLLQAIFSSQGNKCISLMNFFNLINLVFELEVMFPKEDFHNLDSYFILLMKSHLQS